MLGCSLLTVCRLFLVCVFPSLFSLRNHNPVTQKSAMLLQANNIGAPSNSTDDCAFLLNAVQSWLQGTGASYIGYDELSDENSFVLWAELQPVRCDWQEDNGVITACNTASTFVPEGTCDFWSKNSPKPPEQATIEFFAEEVDRRKSEITEVFVGADEPQFEFYVRVFYDESHATSMT